VNHVRDDSFCHHHMRPSHAALLCCAVGAAGHRLPSSHRDLARRAVTPPRAALRLCTATADEPSQLKPPELFGPWEVRSSFSGAEEGWVELQDDGTLTCSRAMGSGREWHATRRNAGGWRLHLTLLDKLGRPNSWVGDVRSDDEFLGIAVSGTVSKHARGDPPRAVAEFRGWKLGCWKISPDRLY